MKLRSLVPHILRSALPPARFAYAAYMNLLCRYTDLKDRRRPNVADHPKLPPASLRYRVNGSPDAQSFLKVGKKTSEKVEAALEKVGRDFDSFRDVLDFGRRLRTHTRLVR